MGRYKYAGETNKFVNAALITLIVILNLMVYMAGVINGSTYIY
jgi:hypothetical protein